MTHDLLGAAFLHARANLEHPRVALGGPQDSITFDATVRTYRVVDNTHSLACSLSYYTTEDVRRFEPGMYDIDAKVIAFAPHINPRSPVRQNEEFALMGDISKLRRVPTLMNESVLTPDDTARMQVCGRVAAVQQETRSFNTTVWPIIRKAPHNAHLDVRAITHRYPSLSYSAQRVPPLNSLITFTGDLLAVRDKVAIVDVDDVTYLRRTPVYHAPPEITASAAEDDMFAID